MHKGDKMIRSIEARVICGSYAPGQKIPSLRQLMNRFGVSMNTARRGIDRLVQRGLLEFRHGSGTYVATSQRLPDPCVIGVVCSIDHRAAEHSYSGLALLGVEDRAADLGFQIRNVMVRFINDAYIEEFSKGLEGLIMLGGYDAHMTAPALGVPCVGLGMHNSYDGLFSLIDIDPFRAAELACDFFRKKRFERVMVIPGDRQNFRLRAELFAERWRSLGGEVDFCDEDGDMPYDKSSGYLFVDGNSTVASLAKYERITGVRMADDLTLLSIDGKTMFSYDARNIDMPTIAINWRLAGALAAEECMRRVRYPGRAARRIYMSPKIYSI